MPKVPINGPGICLMRLRSDKAQIRVNAPVLVFPTKGGGGGEGCSVGMVDKRKGSEKNPAVQKGNNNLYHCALGSIGVYAAYLVRGR
jgi:hypothetical protein